MQIQWYPGHMTKAKRAMKEDIKLIDLVIELVDARVPLGSRNPDIDELAKGKGRIVLLNKADLADDGCTERWIAWFKEQGIHALRINARSGMGMKQIQPLVQEACKEKIERDRRRGIKNRPVRLGYMSSCFSDSKPEVSNGQSPNTRRSLYGSGLRIPR